MKLHLKWHRRRRSLQGSPHTAKVNGSRRFTLLFTNPAAWQQSILYQSKTTPDLKWNGWKKMHGKCGKVGADPIFMLIFSREGLPDNLGFNVNVCIFLQTFSNTTSGTNENTENMASSNVIMGSNVSSKAASASSPTI